MLKYSVWDGVWCCFEGCFGGWWRIFCRWGKAGAGEGLVKAFQCANVSGGVPRCDPMGVAVTALARAVLCVTLPDNITRPD